jgi:hypothetical protein|tara:strand:+ start:1445 stop:4135 length:2691 start_codon:yes stop_codon:yes gene_type:complete
MKKFSEISEAKKSDITISFGRMNPPTIGHEKLCDMTKKVAAGSEYRIYPSFTQNPAKDPLPHSLKVAYMRKMFPSHKKAITVDDRAKTFINVATLLYEEGYRNLTMVAGSDRVAEFTNLLNKYNNSPDKSGKQIFKFDSIKVVSAGERDPDAEGVAGMSASKMRKAAAEGDFDSFKLGLPSKFRDAKKLFRDVRKYMNIRESKDMGQMGVHEEIRDAYLTGKLWNIDDIVEANGVEGRVVNRGTNYIGYMDGSGKVHKAWLHDISINERNYKQEYDSYHSRPEQIANRSSRNKARRIMGDNIIKGMDVGHKDNNPLNNDPKNLRNEDPSINRREPRLREKDELDEMSWFLKAKAKIDQMSHPKSYEAMVNKFIGNMKNPPKQKTPASIAADIANEYSVSPRGLVQYINKLVDKGVLPKELKASYHSENYTFNDLVKNINEVKQDKDIDDKKGAQPAKYYAGDMAKSTKDKRDAHFKKKKSGPAPGDASGKTKPSVHTKKFKQMFGEIEKYDSDKFFGGKGTPEQRTQLLKLQNKALRALGGSPKQNAIKKEIDALRKKIGMKVKSEKLNKNADAGDYIDDFQKSDAPQFKGKSKEKRKDMAIAAYLDKNESLLDKVNLLLSEDGHTDVKSMKNKVQIAMSALQKMQGELTKLGDEDDLPTWWTNKVATAVSRIDDMSDYLDTQVEGYQLDEKIAGLVKKADKSGMPYSVLKKVYDRGMAAWKTGHRPGTTPQQWAFARVNSFTTKSSGTWGKADKDLAKQVEMVERLDEDGPCWDTHKQVGMKKKSGKMVPNCVPKNEDLNEWGEVTEKDDKSGKELNNPTKGDVKKYKVYVKNDKGNVVKVEFGDPNMSIKRDDPEARKNFRARHNCDQKKDKTTAGYWSCKFWSTKSVTDLMKG